LGTPHPGERPKQYFKSRYYSVRDKLFGPRNK